MQRSRRAFPLRRLPVPILLALGLSAAAQAQPSPAPAGTNDAPETSLAEPQTSDQPPSGDPADAPSIRTSLPNEGDPAGFNKYLKDRGITYSLTYIGEVLGNPTGGVKRGAVYQGRLDLQIDARLDQLLGWQGASFHASGYQIHGTGLSRYFLNNLLTTSSIEALPSTRLYELWVEQALFGKKLTIRAGQLAADAEFFLSDTAGLFVNATFGWPAITAVNLPSGGPAYPLATPGVRVKIAPDEQTSLRVAVFNGDPAGPATPFNDPDPQRRNRYGTNFRIGDPALLIAEGAYAWTKDTGASLPGTVKFGYWHHFDRFADQRFDTLGLSLADPSTSGIVRAFRGNDGIYGIVDQAIYREPGSDDRGANVFVRVSGSPADRNLVSFYADAGIGYKGLIPGRPDDVAGLSMAYAQVSQRTRAFDRDTIFFTGTPMPVRSHEALIEATYQAVIVPGFTIQPDFQYVFRPGGNVVNPRDPNGGRIKNAAIFGVRAAIRY